LRYNLILKNMAKRHFISSHTVRSIDKNGNETFFDENKLHSVELDKSDSFYLIYFKMLKTFYEIKLIKDVYLLFRLCEMAEYNTGKISLSIQDRSDLCDLISLRKEHLSAGLKRLSELGLISGSRGSYIINQSIFWKGDKETRNKVLKERGIDFTIRFKL